MSVKISEDFSKVVVGNMKENYILSISVDENGNPKKDEAGHQEYDQSNISCLKDKVIREILHAGPSDFIFICCSEYDQDLDIMCSMDEKFSIGINRRIEPDSICVLDCYQENPNKMGFGDKIAILSLRGDEFFIDTVNPQAAYAQLKGLDDDPYFHQEVVINSNQEDETQAFNSFWPFIVIKGMSNHLLVFNTNDRKLVLWIELPEHLIKIPKTHISETYDLYILGETQHGYEMYCVDLDEFEDEINKKNRIIVLKLLMSYFKADVQDTPLLDFHVRSAPNPTK